MATKRRPTIGSNPLDAVIPSRRVEEKTNNSTVTKETPVPAPVTAPTKMEEPKPSPVVRSAEVPDIDLEDYQTEAETTTATVSTQEKGPVPVYQSSSSQRREPSAPPPQPEQPPRIEKQRMTIHLPVDLVEKMKDAVYWTPGLTLAGLAEDALQVAVEEIEEERGEPFPKRRENLRGGRPIK